MKQLESFLTPETKQLGEWMYDKISDKWSKIYDEAYIRENGVSMRSSKIGYWPGIKEKGAVPEQRDLNEQVPDGFSIRSDRTIRRTGDV